jgi:hypothetical protein
MARHWFRSSTRLALTVAPLLCTPSLARAALVCDRVIDDFSASSVGAFPKGWRTKKEGELSQAKKSGTYTVAQDGKRRVLHARFREEAITIGRSVAGWDLDEYPVLQWEWKAVKLPVGGNEGSLSNNDCGAAVYALWDIGFPFYVDSLKYSWSSSLPVGKHIEKRLGHDHVLVTESGSQRLGRWQTVRVNVKSDHERYFGEKRKPNGIAILTDADGTGSSAEAYYANFKLCRVR